MSGSFSIPIQVVEAGGVTAWLVEDHSVPVVSLAWSWPGGAALDSDEQAGAAALTAALLSEGAGPLDAPAFADALRDGGISLGFAGARDQFEGGFRCLAEALPETVRLARLAMAEPRFDAEAVTRIRARAIAQARQTLETPRGQAGRAFWAAAYPTHPAGRPSSGTAETLAAIPVAALRDVVARQIRHEGLLVAAAGAIGPGALAGVLDQLFGGLPPGAPPAAPPLPVFNQFGRSVLGMDSPQSQVIFGQPGIPVQDPDWEAAQVVLRILAGGGFSSRLMQAVRVERGLTYGIGAGLDVLFNQAIVVGAFASDNAKVAEALEATRAEWSRMAESGPTVPELDEAVAYLTGSLPLQFTDSRRIANTLLALRRNGRPRDWLDGRAARLRALTRDGTAAVAGRLLLPDAFSVAIAGRPVGL